MLQQQANVHVGCLVAVSTHTNMVMDPLVLGVHMPYKRQLHFWAKSTLFANKLAAKILGALGAVPVDRKNKDNAALFASTLKTLRDNKVMAIFPEGTSYTLPHIMPLRDGLSWAALQHALEMEEAGESHRTAPVIPAGITYVEKHKWRSMAIIM
jgi:glycerol-3-phosphate O-acyltransferase/dihydroxyacetone phosphate acyltransferase